MKLYHETNCDFSKIYLNKCRPNKDFGKGFYLTDIRKQALNMAIRKCVFENTGTAVVQVYEFDETILTKKELNIKVFNSVCEEWAEFIIKNRTSRNKSTHNYDIVVGPVADDGVVFQINLYLQHLINMQTLIKELTFRKLNNQYFFGTERAIYKLKRL